VTVNDQHYSPEVQSQLISDRNSMNAQALTLMVPTANAELAAMNQSPGMSTASVALNGLLGYVRAAHSREFRLDMDLRQSLINAQVAGTRYSADSIASALQQAGVPNVTAVQVLAAAVREEKELTSIATPGAGMSPFEAFVIAADVNSIGGFQCDQHTLNDFLNNLLGH
jgi:hypothetical protein